MSCSGFWRCSCETCVRLRDELLRLEKSTESECNTLEYFWTEKEDVTRWVGYEDWKRDHPNSARELGNLLQVLEDGKSAITRFIQNLSGVKSD